MDIDLVHNKGEYKNHIKNILKSVVDILKRLHSFCI